MALPVLGRPRSPERRDPFAELDDLYERFSSLVANEFGKTFGSGMDRWVPLADLEETDDAYTVELDLPGVVQDDLDVQLDDRVLTVSGEIHERQRKGILHRRGRRSGRFHYSVSLPGELDEEHVDAQLRDGVLTLRVPKAEHSRRRRIAISR
jgi:HSP20 family protein